MKTVSVVLATYNGEKYINIQLQSILKQLNSQDELIISDDGSTDKTIDLIKKYMNKYSNIYLINGPKKGISANFENGVQFAQNEIILFADQDDIWNEKKIDSVKKNFAKNSKIDVLLHNAGYCNENDDVIEGNTFFDRKIGHGFWRCIIRSPYYGCCMAIRKDFIKEIIPFSEKDLLYDQYIGLIAELRKKSYFLDEELVLHRLHGDNISKQQSISRKIYYRKKLVKAVIKYMINDFKVKGILG